MITFQELRKQLRNRKPNLNLDYLELELDQDQGNDGDIDALFAEAAGESIEEGGQDDECNCDLMDDE